MGRNKDLRRKIAERERAIAEPENKISLERAKPQPDVDHIGHWEAEVGAWREQVAHLIRRLKRDW